MSKFYVGQRVRKIANRRPEHLGISGRPSLGYGPIGMEGTIDRLGSGECHVAWDGWPISWAMNYMLEPIDDSRELTTWSACAWKPKEMSRA
ncbi:MAG TPA: hypothetical protein VHN11_04900 [Xanthobacteraceae bacterium]|jgi:hypothetical protein|nr:hypothetical protein [Xanthobacteraceae bacterium]